MAVIGATGWFGTAAQAGREAVYTVFTEAGKVAQSAIGGLTDAPEWFSAAVEAGLGTSKTLPAATSAVIPVLFVAVALAVFGLTAVAVRGDK